MNINVEVSELVERKTDDRGRVNLGRELADKQVTVAIVEVAEKDD